MTDFKVGIPSSQPIFSINPINDQLTYGRREMYDSTGGTQVLSAAHGSHASALGV